MQDVGNQASTLVPYLEMLIKTWFQTYSEEAEPRASTVPAEEFISVSLDDILPYLPFSFILQPFVSLGDCCDLWLLLSTPPARWPRGSFSQTSPSQILLLFWVSLPFQVGCVYHNGSVSNMRGNISHNQERSV